MLSTRAQLLRDSGGVDRALARADRSQNSHHSQPKRESRGAWASPRDHVVGLKEDIGVLISNIRTKDELVVQGTEYWWLFRWTRLTTPTWTSACLHSSLLSWRSRPVCPWLARDMGGGLVTRGATVSVGPAPQHAAEHTLGAASDAHPQSRFGGPCGEGRCWRPSGLEPSPPPEQWLKLC